MLLMHRSPAELKSRRRRWQVLRAAAFCLSLALLLLTRADASSAHYEPTYLTYGTSACPKKEKKDPINLVFFSSALQSLGMRNHLTAHTGWGGRSGSDQWVRSHGGCREVIDQATRGERDKHHGRIFPGGPDESHRTDAGNYVYVLGAHREKLTNDGPCGERDFAPDGSHAVYKRINGRSGFDQGRPR